MLNLTSKPSEKQIIQLPDGTLITATVVGIDPNRNQVRIGWDAPRHIAINREKIHNLIQQERLQALQHLFIYEVTADDHSLTIAAKSEESALLHYKAINCHLQIEEPPQITSIIWSPSLIRYIDAGITADQATYNMLKQACLCGKEAPFIIDTELLEGAA